MNTFVCFALEREAAPFRRQTRDWPHVRIAVSGVGRDRARRCVEAVLAATTPSLVIAAGFCGALRPTLRVGDIVESPRIITVGHLVSGTAEKRRLAELHDADAVDMESAAVQDLCAERNVPFRAIRVVSDAVDTALSPELVRLLSGGKVSVWKALAALRRRPALLGEFLRLGRDTKLAARKLCDALVAQIARSAPPRG
ncbi:MAG TPA: hypothetical protein VN641_13165 [Urbifossiella sp.]|nr:hypothetical protein [Urbifossiella sp.]